MKNIKGWLIILAVFVAPFLMGQIDLIPRDRAPSATAYKDTDLSWASGTTVTIQDDLKLYGVSGEDQTLYFSSGDPYVRNKTDNTMEIHADQDIDLLSTSNSVYLNPSSTTGSVLLEGDTSVQLLSTGDLGLSSSLDIVIEALSSTIPSQMTVGGDTYYKDILQLPSQAQFGSPYDFNPTSNSVSGTGSTSRSYAFPCPFNPGTKILRIMVLLEGNVPGGGSDKMVMKFIRSLNTTPTVTSDIFNTTTILGTSWTGGVFGPLVNTISGGGHTLEANYRYWFYLNPQSPAGSIDVYGVLWRVGQRAL